jgi:Ca-activated chloride channel family protein
MKRKKLIARLFVFTIVMALVTTGFASALTLPPTVTKTASPTDINLKGSGGIEETTVTITVTGAGGTSTTITPMDVIFALDSSGSMDWNDPGGERKNASKSFVDKMDDTRDKAGLVSWDDYQDGNAIDIALPLTNDFTLVKSQIDLVDAYGGTDLDAGLNASIGLLDIDKQADASHVIIFLTDGQGNYTSSGNPGSPADDAALKGYVIYSIGLGTPPPSPANLQDMANATGGKYYPAPTADNLQAIFDEIYEEVVTSTIPYNVDVIEVTQSYIEDEGSFNITPDSVVTDGAGITTITWNNIGMISSDGDPDLSADEIVTLSFTAKSSLVGTSLEVDVSGSAMVCYDDNEGNFVDCVPIPQAQINVNSPPDCSTAAPSLSVIWPPNHKFVSISVVGVTDPEGDPFTITVDSIWQDEPVDTLGDGSFTPDGMGVGTDTAEVRAERMGGGNGRVYHISFTVMDEKGATCSGEVLVGVPHDVQDTPIDDGALFDSTALSP